MPREPSGSAAWRQVATAVPPTAAQASLLRSVWRPTALPRFLLVGLATSSVIHVTAVLLIGAIWGGRWLQRSPPEGTSAIRLSAASILVSGASPGERADDEPTIPLRTSVADEPPQPPRRVLQARPMPISRRGELPPASGEETQDVELQFAANITSPIHEATTFDQPLDAPLLGLKSHPKLPRQPPRVKPLMPHSAEAAPRAIASVASKDSRGAQTDLPQRKLYSPPPIYPPEALAARLTGRVVLRVTVETDGRVARVSVYRTSGVRSLDQAALEAVRQWRFEPTRRAGISVISEIAVPVRFELDPSSTR